MKSEKRTVQSLTQMQTWLRALAQQIQGSELILLSGPMGAGKTTIIRTLCEALGIGGVQSPTFSLHQVYQGEKFKVHHFDLYRIESEGELATICFDEILSKRDEEEPELIFVEWPQKAPGSVWPLSQRRIEISIEIGVGPEERVVSVVVRNS